MFKAEIPMDRILDRLVESQTLGKRFSPRSFYVRTREFYIDWMGNLAASYNTIRRPSITAFLHSTPTFK